MTVLLAGEARLEASENCLMASGEAGFDVARTLASKGCEWLLEQSQSSRVCFDLSGVEKASSAVLSVMLEWLRCAQQRNIEVEMVRLSVSLARLTAMAGLDHLLPQETVEAAC